MLLRVDRAARNMLPLPAASCDVDALPNTDGRSGLRLDAADEYVGTAAKPRYQITRQVAVSVCRLVDRLQNAAAFAKHLLTTKNLRRQISRLNVLNKEVATGFVFVAGMKVTPFSANGVGGSSCACMPLPS